MYTVYMFLFMIYYKSFFRNKYFFLFIQSEIILIIIFFSFEYEFELWCLTPLSAIFQLYQDDNFSGGGSQREPPTQGKKLVNFYHLRMRVECTLFCNLQTYL